MMYLSLGGRLFPLKLSTDGAFSLEADVRSIPAHFYFAKVSKQGRIENQTPLIWFESDSVEVRLDWPSKEYSLQETVSFQTASENLESMPWEKQKEYIFGNPNSIPSLYFAETNKEKIGVTDLGTLLQNVNEHYRTTDYYKRIEYFVAAKKLANLEEGSKVENFFLPNKEGSQVSILGESGKPTLISLFSSGCTYSIASISMLEEISAANQGKIQLITIWDDSTKGTWLDTYQEYKSKISWTNLWDQYGFATTYLNRTMWPTFYIVSAEGELLEIVKGYSKKTEKTLKELVQ
jgi:hypothetical protein